MVDEVVYDDLVKAAKVKYDYNEQLRQYLLTQLWHDVLSGVWCRGQYEFKIAPDKSGFMGNELWEENYIPYLNIRGIMLPDKPYKTSCVETENGVIVRVDDVQNFYAAVAAYKLYEVAISTESLNQDAAQGIVNACLALSDNFTTADFTKIPRFDFSVITGIPTTETQDLMQLVILNERYELEGAIKNAVANARVNGQGRGIG